MYRLLILLAAISSAADIPIPTWPQFRGPGGSGIAAPAENPPIEFGAGKGMLWKTPIHSGHSSPAIWGDRIFLTAFDKDAKSLELLSLDRKSGKILWRRVIPTEQIETVHEVSSPATATPAVDGE